MLTGDATAVAVDRIAVESRSVMEVAAASTATSLSPALAPAPSSTVRPAARSASTGLAPAPESKQQPATIQANASAQSAAQAAKQAIRQVNLATEPAPQDEDHIPAIASYTDKDKDKKNEMAYVALARQLAVENARQCPSLGYHIHWIYS